MASRRGKKIRKESPPALIPVQRSSTPSPTPANRSVESRSQARPSNRLPRLNDAVSGNVLALCGVVITASSILIGATIAFLQWYTGHQPPSDPLVTVEPSAKGSEPSTPPTTQTVAQNLIWHAPRDANSLMRRDGSWYEATAPLNVLELPYSGTLMMDNFRVILANSTGDEHLLTPAYYIQSNNNNTTGNIELRFDRYKRGEQRSFMGSFRVLIETHDSSIDLWRRHEVPIREILYAHESPASWWRSISTRSDTFQFDDATGSITAIGQAHTMSSAFIKERFRFQSGFTIEGELSAVRSAGVGDPYEIAFVLIVAEKVSFDSRRSHGKEVQFMLGDGSDIQHSIRETSDDKQRLGTYTSQPMNRNGRPTKFKGQVVRSDKNVISELYVNDMSIPVISRILEVDWMIGRPILVGLRIYNSGTVSVSEFRVHEWYP